MLANAGQIVKIANSKRQTVILGAVLAAVLAEGETRSFKGDISGSYGCLNFGSWPIFALFAPLYYSELAFEFCARKVLLRNPGFGAKVFRSVFHCVLLILYTALNRLCTR